VPPHKPAPNRISYLINQLNQIQLVPIQLLLTGRYWKTICSLFTQWNLLLMFSILPCLPDLFPPNDLFSRSTRPISRTIPHTPYLLVMFLGASDSVITPPYFNVTKCNNVIYPFFFLPTVSKNWRQKTCERVAQVNSTPLMAIHSDEPPTSFPFFCALRSASATYLFVRGRLLHYTRYSNPISVGQLRIPGHRVLRSGSCTNNYLFPNRFVNHLHHTLVLRIVEFYLPIS